MRTELQDAQRGVVPERAGGAVARAARGLAATRVRARPGTRTDARAHAADRRLLQVLLTNYFNCLQTVSNPIYHTQFLDLK